MELKKEGLQKVTSQHLNRNAYLYIRQSTVRQTIEHLKALDVSMIFSNGPLPWAGPRIRLSSLMMI